MRIRVGAVVVDLDSGELVPADSPSGTPPAGSPPVDRPSGPLSPTELRLLRHLHEAGEPVAGDTLLAQVWGYHPGVASRTVLTTVSRLRRKLEVDPEHPVALVTDAGRGYRLVSVAVDEALPPPAVSPPLSDTVGRALELRRLTELVSQGARLVTLHGPGGNGKTHLARRWASGRGQAIGWVDAEAALDAADLARLVAGATGGTLGSGDPVDAARRRLAADPRRVWILDNVEQIERLEAAVGPWLEALPGLVLVLTSRRPVGLPGEWVVELAPLPPDEAATLFARRWSQRDALRPVDEPTVADIAELLAGVPLAIELATSWGGLLPLPELRRRVTEDLTGLSRAEGSVGPDRHASLARCFEGSWQRLAPRERAALARASAFRGGFRLDAARAVLADNARDAEGALAVLRTRSLVQLSPGTGRYDLLVPVREFAAAADPAEARQGLLRMTRWVTAHLEASLDPLVPELETVATVYTTTLPDEANARHALRAAVEEAVEAPARWEDALRLAAAAGSLLRRSGPHRSVLELANRLAPHAPSVSVRTRAAFYNFYAKVLGPAGDAAGSARAFLALRPLAQELGHPRAAWAAQTEAARSLCAAGDLAGAHRLLDELKALGPATHEDDVAREVWARAWVSRHTGGAPPELDALRAACRVANPELSCAVVPLLTLMLGESGRQREALEVARRGAERATLHGLPDHRITCENTTLLHLTGPDKLPEALRQAERAWNTARSAEVDRGERLARRHLGRVRLDAGDVDGAEEALLFVVDGPPGRVEPILAAAAWLHLADVAYAQGRPALVRERYERALALYARGGGAVYAAGGEVRAARLRIALGDRGAAVEALGRAVPVLRVAGLTVAAASGLCWRALSGVGDGEAALAEADALLVDVDEPVVLALRDLVRAHVRGDDPVAREEVRRVLPASFELRLALDTATALSRTPRPLRR